MEIIYEKQFNGFWSWVDLMDAVHLSLESITTLLLDFYATHDSTHHGHQGSYDHCYFAEHIYHPLPGFDGQSAQLIKVVSGNGDIHAVA